MGRSNSEMVLLRLLEEKIFFFSCSRRSLSATEGCVLPLLALKANHPTQMQASQSPSINHMHSPKDPNNLPLLIGMGVLNPLCKMLGIRTPIPIHFAKIMQT
jgi:hypothetical protein